MPLNSAIIIVPMYVPKSAGVLGRNRALSWIRNNVTRGTLGVVYFADDDNTYDIRLFEEVCRVFEYVFSISNWTHEELASHFWLQWHTPTGYPGSTPGFKINVVPVQVCGKVMFLHASVCHSVHGGGGATCHTHPLPYMPPAMHTPCHTHPPAMHDPCHTHNPVMHAPCHARPLPCPPPPATNAPTAIWSMSRRYASYWNASMFKLITLNIFGIRIHQHCTICTDQRDITYT